MAGGEEPLALAILGRGPAGEPERDLDLLLRRFRAGRLFHPDSQGGGTAAAGRNRSPPSVRRDAREVTRRGARAATLSSDAPYTHGRARIGLKRAISTPKAPESINLSTGRACFATREEPRTFQQTPRFPRRSPSATGDEPRTAAASSERTPPPPKRGRPSRPQAAERVQPARRWEPTCRVRSASARFRSSTSRSVRRCASATSASTAAMRL